MDPTIVGIATRVELDSFDGRLSSPDERFLRDSLNATINLSNDERNKVKRVEEGTQLIANAIGKRSNLLCLFTLGGFFVCLVSRMEEIGFSPQGKLLVAMSRQDIPRLPRPTELASLSFLLRIKQLGEDRIRAVPPAEWYAFVNYQNLLTSRPLKIRDRDIIHPGQTERALGIIEKGSRTPRRVISMPAFEPKPSAFGKKPHSPRKPQRRIW